MADTRVPGAAVRCFLANLALCIWWPGHGSGPAPSGGRGWRSTRGSRRPAPTPPTGGSRGTSLSSGRQPRRPGAGAALPAGVRAPGAPPAQVGTWRRHGRVPRGHPRHPRDPLRPTRLPRSDADRLPPGDSCPAPGSGGRRSAGRRRPGVRASRDTAAALVALLALAMLSDAVRPRWRSGTHPEVRRTRRVANRTPGARQNPAYGLLWFAGVAQSYRLFDWIDERNYHITYEMTEHTAGRHVPRWDDTLLFPRTHAGRAAANLPPRRDVDEGATPSPPRPAGSSSSGMPARLPRVRRRRPPRRRGERAADHRRQPRRCAGPHAGAVPPFTCRRARPARTWPGCGGVYGGRVRHRGLFSVADDPSRPGARAATAALMHRGPDGERTWLSPDGRVGLGHARLSIIDPDGDQPIGSEDGRRWLVINGEFYDFARSRRSSRPAVTASAPRSDSEIALHLYEEAGPACLDRLRGEFAFVLWDGATGTIFAARDRFGIKPLFYARLGDLLIFASEAKALFAAGCPAAWDHDAVLHQIFGCFHADRSLFAGVRQLPPGRFAHGRPARPRLVRYWDVPFPRRDREPAVREEERVAEVSRRLTEAVRLRMRADVPGRLPAQRRPRFVDGPGSGGGPQRAAPPGLHRRLRPRQVRRKRQGADGRRLRWCPPRPRSGDRRRRGRPLRRFRVVRGGDPGQRPRDRRVSSSAGRSGRRATGP